MKKGKSFLRNIFIITVILLLLGEASFAESKKQVLVIAVDSISLDNIDQLKIDNMSLGLFNLKARNKKDVESFYETINVGRKIDSGDRLNESLKLEYLSDVLSDENITVIGRNKLNYLLGDKDLQVNRIAFNSDREVDILKNISRAFKESDVVGLEFKIQNNKKKLKTLENIIRGNDDKRIYIIPRELGEDQALLINKSLTNLIIVDGEGGLLTSSSTNREGIVAIEDISVDIKSQFGKKGELDIGREIDQVAKKDTRLELRKLYNNNINMLILAWVFHGLIYGANIFLALKYIDKSRSKLVESFFLFAMNNIVLTLALALLYKEVSIYVYIVLVLIGNLALVNYLYGDYTRIKKLNIINYILIVLIYIFCEDRLYYSYTGFNNIVYGARFYGFNNGMAGVFLGSSMFLIQYIYDLRLKKPAKDLMILGILSLNIVILSGRFAANTGSFITSIFMFIIVFYYYIIEEKINISYLLAGGALIIIVLASNLYLDYINNIDSHALQFFNRIGNNGFKEVYHMASFKLRELIKLSLMPPFSIILILNSFIIIKEFKNIDRLGRTLVFTGLLGFIINDTGNILFIYMINYLLLELFFKDKKSNQKEEDNG